MGFHTWSVWLCFVNFVYGNAINTTLNKISSIRVPHSYGSVAYELDSYDAKAVAYDTNEKVIYCVGWYNIHVIDVSDVTSMHIIHHMSEKKMYKTDVEVCGGYVLVTVDDWDERENGRLDIYRRYDKVTDEMELIHSIIVGVQPNMVLPTRDCKTVVVVVEAEIDRFSGVVKDFEGGVAVIKFPTTLDDTYTMTIVNFSHYDSRIGYLESESIRFVNRENGNTFANDAQPKSVTLSSDETKAYIALQTNNAIAVLDIASEEIVEIHGLGYKDWRKYTMDASDRDGGINLKSWPVYGMYQPDAIQLMTINGIDYIVSANEGKSKDKGCCYEEEIRVKDVVLSEIFDADVTTRAELQREELLGRLEVSKVTGYNETSGAHDALYAFGGRGFSIWHASNMSMVYDSGDEIPSKIATLFPELFNCDVDEGSTPLDLTDVESEEKGEETKSIAIARTDRITLIILGIKRPGLIAVYSVDETKPNIQPEFEGLYHDIQRFDKNWEDLVDDGEASMLEPDDIKYFPDTESPNGQHIIAVAGTASGTVTLLELKVIAEDNGVTGSTDAIQMSTDMTSRSADTTPGSTDTTPSLTDTTQRSTNTTQGSTGTTPVSADTTERSTDTTLGHTATTRMSKNTIQGSTNTTPWSPDTTQGSAYSVQELPLAALIAITTGSVAVVLGFVSTVVYRIISHDCSLAGAAASTAVAPRNETDQEVTDAKLSRPNIKESSAVKGGHPVNYQKNKLAWMNNEQTVDNV